MSVFQIVWVWLISAVGSALPLILILIGVDLLLGIFSAIKRGAFEWGKVGQFYRTMVIPYVGGYLVLQLAFTLLAEQLGSVLSPTLSGIALAAILTTLVTSIKQHLCDIGLGKFLTARGLCWCD